MDEISIVGIDLAKNIFQIHAVDAAGKVVLQRALRRSDFLKFFGKLKACLIGMEACAGSHHWARELTVLGHEVRLIPPAYVKAYVRRQKNDAADAAAICEAVGRPSMRFVAVKSREQQGALMLHRTRDLLMSQRVALINALRAHLAEFGIVVGQGVRNIAALEDVLMTNADDRIPPTGRAALVPLVHQIHALEDQIAVLDKEIHRLHMVSAVSRRLATIPGVGPLIASAIVASIGDPAMFKSGREFAAFLGLVPRQSSSGGKERLGRISKMGDRYLRKLLVVGATAVLRHAGKDSSGSKIWAEALLAKKPFKLVAVALANKNARIIWALLVRGGVYGKPLCGRQLSVVA